LITTRLFHRTTKILKWILISGILTVVICIGIAAALLSSNFGKNQISKLLEYALPKYVLEGQVKIGKIEGNFFNHLFITDVKVFDKSNHPVFQTDRVDAQLELSLTKRPYIQIDTLTFKRPVVWLTQDRRGEWSVSKLLKQDNKKVEKKESVDQEDSLKPPVFLLGRLLINQGQVVYRNASKRSVILKNVESDLAWPAGFENLPWGEVEAYGQSDGLKAKISLKSNPKPSEQPLTLSAVAKDNPVPRTHIVLKANLGTSRIHAESLGSVELNSPKTSVAHFRLIEIRIQGNELDRLIPNVKDLVVEARGHGEYSSGKVAATIEGHFTRKDLPQQFQKQKLLAEASLLMKNDEYEVTLNRLRWDAECSLLNLKRPAHLSISKNTRALPLGSLELASCGGNINYKTQKAQTSFNIIRFEPVRIARALGVQIPSQIQPQEAQVNARFFIDKKGALTGEASLGHGGASAHNVVLRAHLKNFSRANEDFPVITADKASGELSFETAPLELATLSELYGLKTPLDGVLHATLTAKGNLKRASLASSLTLAEMRSKQTTIQSSLNAKLDAHYDGEVLVLGGNVFGIALDGKMNLAQSDVLKNPSTEWRRARLTFSAKTEKLDLVPVLSTFSNVNYAAQGVPPLFLVLDAEVKGTAAQPNVKLDAALSAASERIFTVEARTTENEIHAKLKSENASVDSILQLGRAGIQSKNARLNAEINANGTFKAPVITGSAMFNAERLGFADLLTAYRNVRVELLGNGNRIDIRQIHLDSGDGSLNGNGFAEFSDGRIKAFSIDTMLKEFEALSSDRMRLEVSGRANAHLTSMPNAASQFGGSIQVTEAKLNMPELLGTEKAESLAQLEDVVLEPNESKLSAIQKDEEPRDFSPYVGSLHVSVPGRFWVKGPDLDLELKAELDVGLDDDQEPLVRGTVESRRGAVEVLGRRFKVKNALLQFTGDPRNPVIAADAVYAATPYSIVVSAHGPLEDLKPKISSDPTGLSQDESIGVLLTGNPDYSSKGSGQSTSGRQLVVGAFSGFVADKFKKTLGPALPIDTFVADFSTDRSGSGTQSSIPQARIEVGKYLSDKIFVKVGRDFDPVQNEPFQRISLDYRLSEKWSLETTQTDRGRSDLGVQWTLNY